MPRRKESAFAARTSHPFAHQLAHPLSVPARVYRLGLDLDSIHEIPVARTAFQHSREIGRRPMCAATPTRAPPPTYLPQPPGPRLARSPPPSYHPGVETREERMAADSVFKVRVLSSPQRCGIAVLEAQAMA